MYKCVTLDATKRITGASDCILENENAEAKAPE